MVRASALQVAALAAALLALPVSGGAQEVAAPAASPNPAPSLRLTLAGAEAQAGACRISLLAENALGAEIAGLTLEAVIFDRAGNVARLALFDLRELPQGRPRLRQFDLPGLDCAALGEVLINGAARCEGPGLTPGACISALRLETRIGDVRISG